MKQSMFYAKVLPLFSTLALLACEEQSNFTTLAGHYEDADETLLQQYRHDQTIIPEHAPSQGVIMSRAMFTEHGLEDMAAELLGADIDTLWIVVPQDYATEEEHEEFSVLYRKAKQHQHKIKLLRPQVDGRLREWARDWAPLTARTSDGELRLLDFNYYPERPADDNIPAAFAQMTGLERVSLPIYNEGGNFMNNSQGDCLMTERVVLANADKEIMEDQIFNEAQIKQYYQEYVGCKRVIITPYMPYEGTRHIDLWAKFINDDTIIVNEIRDEKLALTHYRRKAPAMTREVKDFLDQRASDLESMGFKVVRIPMPLPFFGEFKLFRSYTNSLILNGTVFIPRYRKPYYREDGIDGRYVDDRYTTSDEEEVERIHQDLGLKVVWVPSDQMISKGGAVHCTTMQIPRGASSCNDTPPPDTSHTCQQQSAWGKCEEGWMRHYCHRSCGRC